MRHRTGALAATGSPVSGADIALLYDVLDTADAERAQRRSALGAYTLAQVGGEATAALAGSAIASSVSLIAAGWTAAAELLLPLAIAFGGIRRTRWPCACSIRPQ